MLCYVTLKDEVKPWNRRFRLDKLIHITKSADIDTKFLE